MMKKKLALLFLFPFLLLVGCKKGGGENVTPVEDRYINVAINELSIEEEETYQIEVETIKKGTIIFYSSSNDEIATVTDNGLITGVKQGETSITIRGGKDTYIIFVTVNPYQAKDSLQIVLTKNSFALELNETFVLPLIVKLGNEVINNASLSYEYSESGVVSISDITLTTLSVGTVTCAATATYQNYEANATFSVTVY